MIQEVIITTQNSNGVSHIAPMGVHVKEGELIILPFCPSLTLDNILATRSAVINYCDDVRVFAGCLTGRREWPLQPALVVKGKQLTNALAHREVELMHLEDDPVRPKLICKTVYAENHRPFQGFNRAQYSVLEVAILISRLGRLTPEKIAAEIAYLQIGFDKTAGPREREAWQWLMTIYEDYQKGLNP